MRQAREKDTAVRAEIRRFIEESFMYMRPELELKDDDDLLGLGIIDSMGFVELVEEVQSRFGVEVADAEITEENFGTVSALVAFVDRKRSP